MKYLKLYEDFDNKSVFTTPDEIGVSWLSDIDLVDDSGVDEDVLSIYHVSYAYNDYQNDVTYYVYKIGRDNKFFLVNKNDEILDYEKEINDWKEKLEFDEKDEETNTHLAALKEIDKEFLKKFTYEYQKNFLDEHPENVKELEKYGYHKDLVNDPDYAWIFDQENNGFFGLKN